MTTLGMTKEAAVLPSPLEGEGGAKRRMRGILRAGRPLIRLGAARRSTFSLRGRREGAPAPDPAAAQFRQGDTLGGNRKHWFRAKFFQQYRLFFRFDSASRIIVFAWVNDDDTLRAYGSRTDAYATFRSMLENGNPPDDFDALLKAAKASARRFKATVERAKDG